MSPFSTSTTASDRVLKNDTKSEDGTRGATSEVSAAHPVFHAGELAAQTRAGTRGAASELATGFAPRLNFARNHDAFVAARSFAVVGFVSERNNVWVTPLFSKPGDLSAASESEIVISRNTIPRGDGLLQAKPGTPLSILGIDLERRIRHRIQGRLGDNSSSSSSSLLSIKVDTYWPNCPKYINRRQVIPADQPVNKDAKRISRTTLTKKDQEFIKNMDTLWLGTYAPGTNGGADVNHRGGKPGFVRVTSSTTIEWPEYRGNGMFFMSGNLEVNKNAGVTLFDFETGSMLQLSGTAVVDWHHNGSYEGATRVMKFTVENIAWTEGVTNHRWKRLDYSPYNPSISGSVQTKGELFPVTATLTKIVKESDHVKTFRFVAERHIPFLPGQYATFEFSGIPGGNPTEVRTWTLSETPNSITGDNTLDVSVKRMPNGLVTNWLHDHASVGLKVKVLGVQGDMTAVTKNVDTGEPTVHKSLVLLSAGVGITPSVAMVRGIGAFELTDKVAINMIHVERNEDGLMFQSELQRRARNYPNFKLTNIISSKEGRLSKERLCKLLPENPQDQQAYVCGPTGFMTTMTEHLVALGVPAASIHTESFEF